MNLIDIITFNNKLHLLNIFKANFKPSLFNKIFILNQIKNTLRCG